MQSYIIINLNLSALSRISLVNARVNGPMVHKAFSLFEHLVRNTVAKISFNKNIVGLPITSFNIEKRERKFKIIWSTTVANRIVMAK